MSLLIFGCSPLKKAMIPTGGNPQETAIYSAIRDFSTNCNLFKKDSVFSVSFADSVFYDATLTRIDDRTACSKQKSLYEGVIAVGIITSDYQFYYSEETKGKLPTRYVIKDGKLFYWWDDSYPITEEMITILWKYNRLQTDLIIPEFSTNDNQKGADYYFCKGDLSKYKRVVTNIGMGYYKPPKLNCNK